MSRHHNRFERDYRSAWERRERCAALNNSFNSSCITTNSCAGANVPPSGNNRPGLLPLPVIPSLLLTPVTIAVSTSNDSACKRVCSTSTTPTIKVSGPSPGENHAQGQILAPGVRWGQTPINQSTPWETDEPPAKQIREKNGTGTSPGLYP